MKKIDSITIKEEELTEFVVNNFEEGAVVEISYNRVFVPGKIVHIYEDATITLQLLGKLLNQRVDIDINEVKKELLEIIYTFNEKSLRIIIEN